LDTLPMSGGQGVASSNLASPTKRSTPSDLVGPIQPAFLLVTVVCSSHRGPVAGELIHLGQAALSCNEQIDTFIHPTFNVPTFSETYKYAAYDGLQRLSGRQTVLRLSERGDE
jgi:hypothetical protein